MDTRLLVLKLVLDNLGVPKDISNVQARKRIQKAVYLAQLKLGLGYQYNWYLMGPYSPDLTSDYFSLKDAMNAESGEKESQSLKPEYESRLKQIRPLLSAPSDFPLSEDDWLELLASVHYLLKSSGFKHDKAREVLSRQKPNLAPYYEYAEQKLQTSGLV